MSNQELSDYIKKQQESGFNDEQIKNNLIVAGWGKEEIEKLFKASPIINSFNYYSVRAIMAAEFIVSLFYFLSSIFSFYFQSILYFGDLIAGFIGLVGSIGLFRFKKSGLYSTYLFLIWLGVSDLISFNQTISGYAMVELFIIIPILIYLIGQRKFILDFKDQKIEKFNWKNMLQIIFIVLIELLALISIMVLTWSFLLILSSSSGLLAVIGSLVVAIGLSVILIGAIFFRLFFSKDRTKLISFFDPKLVAFSKGLVLIFSILYFGGLWIDSSMAIWDVRKFINTPLTYESFAEIETLKDDFRVDVRDYFKAPLLLSGFQVFDEILFHNFNNRSGNVVRYLKHRLKNSNNIEEQRKIIVFLAADTPIDLSIIESLADFGETKINARVGTSYDIQTVPHLENVFYRALQHQLFYYDKLLPVNLSERIKKIYKKLIDEQFLFWDEDVRKIKINFSALGEVNKKDIFGFKTYTNTEYGYQISYDPKIYTVNAFGPEPKENSSVDNVLFFKTADLDSPAPIAIMAINVFPNLQELSSENYLKQNYQKWLGFPSNYSDFYINEPIIFNSLNARRFSTERDQYILVIKGKFAFIISDREPELRNNFKFTQ